MLLQPCLSVFLILLLQLLQLTLVLKDYVTPLLSLMTIYIYIYMLCKANVNNIVNNLGTHLLIKCC